MATDPTTSHSSHVGPSIPTDIDANLIAEVRESTIGMQLVDARPLNGAGALSFPRLSVTVSASAITSGTAEADAQSLTTLTAATATATPAVKAAHVLQSMLSIATSAVNWSAAVPQILGRALADIIDVDILDLCGGFSNTVGTSGADCSFTNLRAALLKLRTVAKGEAGKGVFVLHPQQCDDVDADVQNGVGAGLSTMMSRPDLINWFGGSAGEGVLGSYRGSFMNVPVLQSTNIPDENSAADHGGAVLIPGAALGMAIAWAPMVSMADQGVNLKVAKSWQATACYGVVEKSDSRGVSIITDHA